MLQEPAPLVIEPNPPEKIHGLGGKILQTWRASSAKGRGVLPGEEPPEGRLGGGLLRALLAAAVARAHHLAVEAHLHGEVLVMIGDRFRR